MANDLGDLLTSFGCFDDSDVPSLFEDLEALSNVPEGDCSPIHDSSESGLSSPGPGYDVDMLSIGSCSPEYQTEHQSPNPEADHSYAENTEKSNPVMTGAVSPEHEWSPSPRGSVSSSDHEDSNELLLYLMNETGVNIAEKQSESEVTKTSKETCHKQRSSGSLTTSQNRSRKRQILEEDISDDVQQKNRKNAIAARENRLKKKRYIEGLEKENKALTAENAHLIKDNNNMKSQVSSLEAEIDYLKSVLYNQSALSGLLKKLGPHSEVRLSSSFRAEKEPAEKSPLKPNSSGGVCLHVNGRDASLEFCAQCALMAEGAPQQ